MNDVDVAELRRLLAAATAGPWRVLPLGSQFEIMGQDDLGRDDVSVADVGRRPDAELAAVAVNNLAALLDRLDVAEARVRVLEDTVHVEQLRTGRMVEAAEARVAALEAAVRKVAIDCRVPRGEYLGVGCGWCENAIDRYGHRPNCPVGRLAALLDGDTTA